MYSLVFLLAFALRYDVLWPVYAGFLLVLGEIGGECGDPFSHSLGSGPFSSPPSADNQSWADCIVGLTTHPSTSMNHLNVNTSDLLSLDQPISLSLAVQYCQPPPINRHSPAEASVLSIIIQLKFTRFCRPWSRSLLVPRITKMDRPSVIHHCESSCSCVSIGNSCY